MIPYGEFQFFYIALGLMIPVIVLGLFGKRSLIYNAIITFIMIVLIFSDETFNLFQIPWLSIQLISFIMYVLWQLGLIYYYVHAVKRSNTFLKFAAVITLSILPLIVVKVLQSSWLGEHQIHLHGHKLVEWVAFLGISYLTFKSVQLLMEIRDKSIKEVDMLKVLQFITFFPTISSGPIDRYKRFIRDDKKVPSSADYQVLLHQAIHKIMLGFLYKYIIAYLINQYAIVQMKYDYTKVLDLWLYMYAYSFYLFFDFAGYSLFAIAFSYLFGIKTPENFKQPFKAKHIKDFWNRWHLSLSFWFRDCIYMRFLFFMSKKKWIKDTLVLSNLAFFINFFIMGIWHGLEVFYIVYGLYHAALFILYGYYEKWRKQHPPKWNNKWTQALSIVITFHFVAFGFLIFSGKLI
ncbi:D-alanyl-lipoteichoic acid biosynthesis protein DltB [Staphylococcus massiliensis]|uniref:D-alanyl-lipoteichoic acid biosynthesis protein DltB n=1 Tax=Staphylococcus massiliensis TaxID=555791 RepID=UPI001EE0F96C|nr:D-alanyl-lipoteichoic acid biosynthesis protein DltB [Staphylococcus massiliensis]MCG3401663.1 D-alanyl-lipoteichoic acid biosynthesis protein DltB [Staphylococcus massiliensis]